MRPLPRGEYATILAPSSLAVFKSPIVSSSMSKVKGEYSTSMAAMGWMAWARRRVEAEISESPMCLTFPALGRMSILVCELGRNSDLLDELGHRSDGVFDRDRGVGTVEVVQVDVIDPQPRQGFVERRMNVLRVTIHDPARISTGQTELCGKEDLVALSGLLEPV